jgi:CBS domain containing-hemolysin-like protein
MEFIGLIILKLLLLLIMLSCSAFFSGSESALFSLNRIQLQKLKEDQHPTYPIISSLLAKPRRLLVSILLGNEMVNVSASIITASIVFDIFSRYGLISKTESHLAAATAVSVGFLTPVILLVGEITPKTIAVKFSVRIATFVARPLYLFSQIIRPLRWAIRKISDGIINAIGGEHSFSSDIIHEEEFKTLMEMGEEEGVIDTKEKELIHRVFDLAETQVSQIMTPRTEIAALPVDVDRASAVIFIKEKSVSRIPIYRASLDDLVGVLYVRDLLSSKQFDRSKPESPIKELLRPPYYVPLTKRAGDLFREFQLKKIHMAIVVDEYGGTAGLITMEDILEELFGEIPDELDVPETKIVKLEEGKYLVNAKLYLDEFDREFGTNFQNEQSDTIAGFVLDLFGKLPLQGESISWADLTFTIHNIQKTKLKEILVERAFPAGESSGDEPGAPSETSQL